MLKSEINNFKNATKNQLRNFGWVVGGVFLGLAGWFWFRQKSFFTVFLWIGLPLVVAGTIIPTLLRWIYVGWMTLAVLLGHVVSTMLLIFLFYLVIFPVGLVARLVGKDFLSQKLERNSNSYWLKRPVENRNYEQQF